MSENFQNKEGKSKLEEGTGLNLQFDKLGGLLPVVVQEQKSGEILMLGYTNEEAFEHTRKHNLATFWSRSRRELWIKGETSGNRLHVCEIRVDCDQDALVYIVKLEGKGACHTKNKKSEFRKSCFYRKVDTSKQNLIFD